MSTTNHPWKAALVLLATLATAKPLLADPPATDAFRGIRLLALAPLAGKATLQLPDEGLVLLKEGDEVAGTGAAVVEVLTDRLVLEDRSGEEVSWIWLYKPERPGGPSRLQRVSRPDPEPLVSVPAPAWIGVEESGEGREAGIFRLVPEDAGQQPSPEKKKEQDDVR